jgi:hypothetical protein
MDVLSRLPYSSLQGTEGNNNGLFEKNSRALGDRFDCDKTLSFPRHILQEVYEIARRALHFYISCSLQVSTILIWGATFGSRECGREVQ